ncbi:MAG: formylglycine-generating enzyme family protein [Gammaproteobacteria bacterium]|nr:formylglycine-generating enzyme family protein [Gammaproteobacteria bacterium]
MLRRAAMGLLLLGASTGIQAAEQARAPGTTFRDCDTCPEMIVVPAGSFVMGAPGESLVIRIPQAFALGRTEVTRGEFARFIADSSYEPRPGCRSWDPALSRFNDDARRGWQNPTTPVEPTDDHPVTCVSFADARAYTDWLAHETGERYRLASEAEWEYAARGGTTTRYPWGDAPEDGCEFANTYDVTADSAYRLGWSHTGCRDGFPNLAQVGQLQANAFKLQDMIGNVQEWVLDCATDSYVGRPRDARAWEWLGGCKRRIQRGGSWLTPPDGNRSAHRAAVSEDDRGDDAGFRVARDLDQRTARAEDR